MKIVINHQIQVVEDSLTLGDLLRATLGEEALGVAVAVNAVVVPKPKYQQYLLQENDEILLITATQGG